MLRLSAILAAAAFAAAPRKAAEAEAVFRAANEVYARLNVLSVVNARKGAWTPEKADCDAVWRGFTKAAELGHPKATYYLSGLHRPEAPCGRAEPRKAEALLRRAAALGEPEAKAELARRRR